MILLIISTIITVILVLYIFILYIQWSKCYQSKVDTDFGGTVYRGAIGSYLMLPRCVQYSLGYFSRLLEYYQILYLQFNITPSLEFLNYKCEQ
jgi:hypothetical protein